MLHKIQKMNMQMQVSETDLPKYLARGFKKVDGLDVKPAVPETELAARVVELEAENAELAARVVELEQASEADMVLTREKLTTHGVEFAETDPLQILVDKALELIGKKPKK